MLAASTADQTEVVVIGVDSALTRFANSGIHQNVAERNVQVRVRAIVGKRSGVATTNDLSESALAQVRGAGGRGGAASARGPGPAGPARTAPGRAGPELQPGDRRLLARSSAPGWSSRSARWPSSTACKASGACSTETTEVGVANSRGVRRHELRSASSLLTVILDDEGSGYAERTARDVDAIDAEALGREAVDKAVRSRGAERFEPGEYPVVLEAYAVGEMLTVPRLHGVRGARAPGGHQLPARPARPADRRSADLDLGRRPQPAGPARQLRLRGRPEAARRPDRRTASGPASSTTRGPPPARAARRRATACPPPARSGRSRRT